MQSQELKSSRSQKLKSYRFGNECPECESRRMLVMSEYHQQCPAAHCKHKEVTF